MFAKITDTFRRQSAKVGPDEGDSPGPDSGPRRGSTDSKRSGRSRRRSSGRSMSLIANKRDTAETLTALLKNKSRWKQVNRFMMAANEEKVQTLAALPCYIWGYTDGRRTGGSRPACAYV